MTFKEMRAHLSTFLDTGYQMDYDNEGQIIVYTGLKWPEDKSHQLSLFEPSEV